MKILGVDLLSAIGKGPEVIVAILSGGDSAFVTVTM
jgi:hypothetical protein